MRKIILVLVFFSYLFITNAQITELPNGNVGIGTTTPNSKLTIKGHVNIGENGNYRLRVRHVDGKNHTDSNIGSLYLNYNTGKNVLVGWGPNAASDLFVGGRLGIGTTSPSTHIDVINQNQPTESFLRFRVKDALADSFTISNTTGAPGQFIPLLRGIHVTDNRYSLAVMGQTTEANDNGTNALVAFDARRSNGPIQTRPLFVWTSYATKMMTMLANGNLGIGTPTPDSKLTVKGNIHTQEVKVDLNGAVAPDYVFKEDYNLKSLEQVQAYINENGHLPNIPSAAEMEKEGILLKEMNLKLLEKIEELTLYTLEQQKEITTLKEQVIKVSELEKQLASIKIIMSGFIKTQE